MKRVLITGMSGVGKSSVIDALAARGFKAVDADSPAYSHWVAASTVAAAAGTPVEPDRDWVWQEDRMRELLATADAGCLFVSGTAANMGQFLPHFDHVILLSAPIALIVERLASRTTNSYGKDPAEVQRVIALVSSVEPLLRRMADHEIDTSAPLEEVVANILTLAKRKPT
jgi:dephospho-CoA kinase